MIRKRMPAGESGLNLLIARYRLQARQRDLEFNLTREQFREITSQICHYCGAKPFMKSWNHCAKASQELQDHTVYVHNSIDRLDSLRGYTTDNCVSSCHQCNWSKGKLSVSDFLSWVARVNSRSNL